MRIPWDKYETALLIDMYWKIENGEIKWKDGVSSLSATLRTRAINNGIQIDDIFRNENGISLQLNYINCLFNKSEKGFQNPAKLFVEIANLYNSDKNKFNQLLFEAMVTNKIHSNKELFEFWYQKKNIKPNFEITIEYLEDIDEFALSRKLIKTSIFELDCIDDINKAKANIFGNNYFRNYYRMVKRIKLDYLEKSIRYYRNFINDLCNAKENFECFTPENDKFLDDIESQERTSTIAKEIDSDKLYVDFENIQNYSFTNPEYVEFKFDGDKKFTKNWKDLYVTIIKKLYEIDEEKLLSFKRTNISNGNRIDFGTKLNYDSMVAPKEITMSFYVETNLSATDIVKKIKILFDLFNIEYCTVEIKYNKKNQINSITNVETTWDHSDVDENKDTKTDNLKDDFVFDESTDYCVDFNNIETYAFTSPKYVEFKINSTKKHTRSWKDVYVCIIKKLYDLNSEKLLSLNCKNIGNGKRIDFGTDVNFKSMVAPREIIQSFYVETSLSATAIVEKLKILLDTFDQKYEDYIIVYSSKNKSNNSSNTVKLDDNGISRFGVWLKDTNYSDSIVEKYTSIIADITKDTLTDLDINELKIENVKDILSQSLSDYSGDNFEIMLMRSAVRKYIQFLLLMRKKQSARISTITFEKNDSYENVDMSDIIAVLEKNFSNGYRYTSKIGRRRFENLYETQIGHPLELSEDELINRIEYLCVIVDDIAYLTSSMISEELKAKILSYIQNSFNSGKSTVYLEAIVREFSDEFFKTCIGNNVTLLKTYLEKVNAGNYFVNYNFISSQKDIKINPEDEIRDVLTSAGIPLTHDELFVKLPHLPQSKIKFILSTTDRFIKNQTSQYFDIDIVNISQTDLDEISTYIANAIYNRGYLGGKELVSTIRSNYNDIVEQNQFLTELGLRDAIGYLLKDYYSFRGKIISSKDEKLDMKKIFADFCKNTGTFTLDDLYIIKDELGTPIYFDSVYENSLRVSKDQFVPKNSIDFPVSEIDKVLEQFCPGDYVSIQDVNTFGLLPYIDYPWNEFLLEHYVDSYSNEFKLLNFNHNAKKIVGAIVKKNSPYYDIEQILADAIAESGLELSENIALDYLIERGFLASRSYSNMAGVITNARKIRNQR